jgi:membrane protease YdiL (CAAX protease family)
VCFYCLFVISNLVCTDMLYTPLLLNPRGLCVLIQTLAWIVPSLGWLNTIPDFFPTRKLQRRLSDTKMNQHTVSSEISDSVDTDLTSAANNDITLPRSQSSISNISSKIISKRRYGRKESKGSYKPVSAGGSDWFTLQYEDRSHYFRWYWWIVGGYCVSVWLVRLVDIFILRLIDLSTNSVGSSLDQINIADDLMSVILHPENQSRLAMLFGSLAPCLIGPIWEELLFRGFLLPLLSSIMPGSTAMLLSAALFALQHGQIDILIQLFTLGLLWNFIYLNCKNLLVTMLVHIMWNSRSLVSTLLHSYLF